MKLLIAGLQQKLPLLNELGNILIKFGINYKIVTELESSNRNYYTIKRLLLTTRKFNKMLNEFNPDAVFIDSPHYFGFFVPKLKIPMFMYLRGDYWSEIKWARDTLFKLPPLRLAFWLINKNAEKSIKQASTLIPICKYLAEITRQHYPQKSIEVMYNGVSPSLWYQVEKMELKHPCVGLLQDANIWGKTREMFTLTKVLESMPDVTFYWVGGGPYKDKVLPTLQKYKNFKWLGYLKYPEEVRKFLGTIDVYALVSGIDMAPSTLLEAQLMERPVVCTKVGGIPELMEDGKTGYLVKKGDADDLIKKISILLDDDAKAKQMGKEARRFVEKNFTWELIAKRFSEILKSKV